MKKCIAMMLCVLILCGCSSIGQNNWESSYAEHLDSLKEENFQFGLYDMDQDEIPELLIEQEEKMYGVYTFQEGSIVKIGEIFLTPYVTNAQNSVFTYGGAGTGVYQGFLYTLKDGTLEEKQMFEASYQNDTAEFYFDDQSISEEEYKEQLATHKMKEISLYRMEDVDTANGFSAFVTENKK